MKGDDPGPAAYALACIEAYLDRGHAPEAPPLPLYARPAACFVSLKKHGELRGCIGTLTPAETDLGHEIARNAYGAAFRDPRFPALTTVEAAALTCSVDVLGEPEECGMDDLDPARYGVIVSAGHRRGVLLPDLPGVETIARQASIALQKGGIDPQGAFRVQRFSVRRFAHGDAVGVECGRAHCTPPGCLTAADERSDGPITAGPGESARDLDAAPDDTGA